MSPPLIVIPLYIAKGDRAFRHWGSGVLFKYCDKRWLLTAAHVCDGERGNENVLICGGIGEMIPLPKPSIQTAMPSSGARLDDKFDLAVISLGPDLATKLEAIGFTFAPENCMIEREVMRIEPLIFYGFPYNLQDCQNGDAGTWISIQPIATHTRLVSAVEATALGYPPDTHLVLRYNVSRDKPLPTQSSATPMPPGMSGSAVLLVQEGGFGLAGIVTRWFDPGYIVAARAPNVIRMLEECLRQIESSNDASRAS
jgi:hypothetical protein